jgi:hypothetical protein
VLKARLELRKGLLTAVECLAGWRRFSRFYSSERGTDAGYARAA